jgi:hypothetical protein
MPAECTGKYLICVLESLHRIVYQPETPFFSMVSRANALVEGGSSMDVERREHGNLVLEENLIR